MDNFQIRSDSGKHRGQCRQCVNEYKVNYRNINFDKMLKMEKEYRENNKTRLAKIKKIYNDTNKIQNRKSNKMYRNNNKEKINISRKNARANNINIKLTEILRSRLNIAIRKKQKSGSAVNDLGCSIKHLIDHLEGKFYSHPIIGTKMTWNNHSRAGWHIDHIKPLSAFDLSDRQQLIEACHYTNLQPMWAEENIRKGGK